MTPSVTGTSYCLPVRLSVIVSVSAINRSVRELVVGIGAGVRVAVRTRDRVAGDPVTSIRPSRQVFLAAALAAEGAPPLVAPLPAAQHAQRSFVHPNHCTSW